MSTETSKKEPMDSLKAWGIVGGTAALTLFTPVVKVAATVLVAAVTSPPLLILAGIGAAGTVAFAALSDIDNRKKGEPAEAVAKLKSGVGSALSGLKKVGSLYKRAIERCFGDMTGGSKSLNKWAEEQEAKRATEAPEIAADEPKLSKKRLLDFGKKAAAKTVVVANDVAKEVKKKTPGAEM